MKKIGIWAMLLLIIGSVGVVALEGTKCQNGLEGVNDGGRHACRQGMNTLVRDDDAFFERYFARQLEVRQHLENRNAVTNKLGVQKYIPFSQLSSMRTTRPTQTEYIPFQVNSDKYRGWQFVRNDKKGSFPFWVPK